MAQFKNWPIKVVFLDKLRKNSSSPLSASDMTPLLERSLTPTMLDRMLRNLLSIYEQNSEEPKSSRVRALLELLENEQPDPELPH
jgi:hypothetical protein